MRRRVLIPKCREHSELAFPLQRKSIADGVSKSWRHHHVNTKFETLITWRATTHTPAHACTHAHTHFNHGTWAFNWHGRLLTLLMNNHGITFFLRYTFTGKRGDWLWKLWIMWSCDITSMGDNLAHLCNCRCRALYRLHRWHTHHLHCIVHSSLGGTLHKQKKQKHVENLIHPCLNKYVRVWQTEFWNGITSLFLIQMLPGFYSSVSHLCKVALTSRKKIGAMMT